MAQNKLIYAERSSSQISSRTGWYSIPTFWQILIIICLAVGIAFRLSNLEDKVFQYDETISMLRVSGYTEPEAVQQLAETKLIRTADLQQYQQPDPEKGVEDTVRGLALEEAQLTPLYFVLLRFWTEIFGSTVAVIRMLSVAGSLLALPCMYWLCVELFQSALAGWLGVAILAVSPFQLLYAQEARPNSLWATTILLSSAALLRAMRVRTKASWFLYFVATTASFYTYLFSGFVAIAHVLYVLGVERFRPTRRMVMFAIALGMSLLSFSPWLFVIASTAKQVSSATNWTSVASLSLHDIYQQWMFYLSSGFVDVGDIRKHQVSTITKYFFSLFYWLSRFLVLYGLYLLCRKTSSRAWLFVLTLICVPVLGLLLPDLILGGNRFTIARYLVPLFLGCYIAVTYVLSLKVLASGPKYRGSKYRGSKYQDSKYRGWRIIWSGVTVTLLFAGILSCGIISQSDTWWNKQLSNSNPKIAEIINQTERPLVISDAALGDLLSISHYLDPKVRLLVRPYGCPGCQIDPEYRKLQLVPYLPPIPSGYSDVFLFHPRPQPLWKKRLKEAKYYPLKVLVQKDDEWLWKVKL